MSSPKLWRDQRGNWYTGDDGTVPISPFEAVRLLAGPVPPRSTLTVRDVIVLVTFAIGMTVLVIGLALYLGAPK